MIIRLLVFAVSIRSPHSFLVSHAHANCVMKVRSSRYWRWASVGQGCSHWRLDLVGGVFTREAEFTVDSDAVFVDAFVVNMRGWGGDKTLVILTLHVRP